MSRSIHELLAAWEAAEARLYPVAMTRPEVYARALTLVQEIVAELAACDSVEALAEAYEDAAGVAARAIERSGAATRDVDVALAASAAFAMRYRAIVASVARAEALVRIREATRRGPGWVTLYESGDAGVGPFVRVEMHLPDGRALRASVDLDAETGGRLFRLEPLRLDPATGAEVDEPPTAEPQVITDADEWEGAVADLRASIEASSG